MNILTVTNGNQSFQRRFPPLVVQAAHDEQYIYVFADIVQEERSALYVLNRQNGELVKEIPLLANHASDMEFFHGRLVMATKPKLTVVDPRSWEVDYRNVLEAGANFEQLYVYDGALFASYERQGKSGWLALDGNFQMVSNHMTCFPFTATKFTKNYLCVMSQLSDPNHSDAAGMIGVFDVKTNQKVMEMMIPKTSHKLQDFYVFSGE